MKHPNLTVERVGTLRCDPDRHQRLYWDGKCPGLGLRVTPSGSRSYIFEGRLHGRTLRLTLGDARTWTLEQARDEACRLKVQTDQGRDPRVERAAREARAMAEHVQQSKRSITAGDAWVAYIAHPAHRWGSRHRADHEALARPAGQPKVRVKGERKPGILRPMLEQPLAAINAGIIEHWLQTEQQTRPSKARHGFVLFRAFWRWCASRPEYAGLVDVSAVESKDVRKQVPRARTRRHDVLERSHLGAWFTAVRGLGNPVASAYLQALLLTGARREEMASLRWADVDLRWGSLWLKDKVCAEGRKVPLTPYLRALLCALPRRNEWVFSSAVSADGRLNEPRIPHNRALSVAGLPHVTLHGLRRTFASLAEWVEMPRGVVAQIMGHAPNATAEKHYINRPLELLAVWHRKYEAWILEQAGIPCAADPVGEQQTQQTLQTPRPMGTSRTAVEVPHLRLVTIG
jgi:integrase